MKTEILKILNNGTQSQQRALFQFDKNTDPLLILKKFNYWSKWFFPKYFKSKDAPFHKDINLGNINLYLTGEPFLNIAFRGGAKTAMTKLFIAFAIANDSSHFRKSFKVLSKDLPNAKQSTTDIYNMLISTRVKLLYPEIFAKSDAKRMETMDTFVTTTGVKMIADSVGVDQRGDLQEESRPDFVWFDDFETRLSLMSAVTTYKIWQNMEEARTGLEKGGGCVYTCNYLSERGNVHKLVGKIKNTLIVPIIKDGVLAWEDRYTLEDINEMKRTDEDFEGERLCKPSASKDVYFDRKELEKQIPVEPIDEIGGLKIFYKYDPSHAYASGHDVAGGVGLDSSTSVIIDFSTVPARVVATYASNEIIPEAFGSAVYEHTKLYGLCLAAVENNKYDQAILKAKQLGAKLYLTQGKITQIGYKPPVTYGWNTNKLTKNQMFSSFKKAIKDGLIQLSDKDLIDEAKAYTRNDIIDNPPDIRMVTNHFDLLTAACIDWQMLPHAVPAIQETHETDSIWETEEELNPAI